MRRHPRWRSLLVALSLLSGALVAGQSARAADVQCKVDYTVNDWGSGFTANLTLTNLGPAINGWTLKYSYAGSQKLTQGWSGDWSQSGKDVTVANLSWNGTLATNASVSLGANFTYSGTNADPTSFSLNGTTCTGAHQAPTVTLTSPAAGATYSAGATVPLAATAAAADGASISKVEFYDDTTLLGTDTSAPYAFDWTSV